MTSFSVIPARAESEFHPVWEDAVPQRARFVLREPRSIARAAYPSGRELVASYPLRLAAGEARLVRGRLAARNLAPRPEEQQLQIGCAAIGAPADPAVFTSRNNEGRFRGRDGMLTVTAMYLFVAPLDGSYRCSLIGRSSGERVTAHPGTSLSISREAEVSAAQWSYRTCDSKGGRVTPDEVPLRASTGCGYLVPRARGGFAERAEVLASDRFIASEAARAIDVIADLQVTTCYQGTRSCAPEVSRYGGRSPHSSAKVRTRLDVVQLDLLGRPCARTSYPRGARFGTTVISARAHHQKIGHRVVHPISSADGCTRRFHLGLVAIAAAGDPIKMIELLPPGPRRVAVPDGLHGRAMSNMIALNVL